MKTLLRILMIKCDCGDIMSACDIRGQNIEVGAHIRYSGTGTVSKVSDIKEDEGKFWVKLEETELWYSPDSLEVITEKDLIDVDSFDDKRDMVDKLRESQADLSDSLNDIQGCEGGG